MRFLQGLLPVLLCWISLFSFNTIALPANGHIPLPEELEEYLEARANGTIPIHTRSSVEERGIVSCLRSLCCFGTQDVEGGQEMGWSCPTQWPTLDDLKSHIQQFGNVGRQISFFYTGLGGGSAIDQAIRWAGCHTNYVPQDPGFVTWRTIVDEDWYNVQVTALARIYGLNNLDPFQKLLSQAFAEVSAGDVYLFTRPAPYDPANPPAPASRTTVAWAGWEYPALTRNANVRTIYRVDPSDTQNDRSVLWTPSDGPSQYEPLGLYNAGQPL